MSNLTTQNATIDNSTRSFIDNPFGTSIGNVTAYFEKNNTKYSATLQQAEHDNTKLAIPAGWFPAQGDYVVNFQLNGIGQILQRTIHVSAIGVESRPTSPCGCGSSDCSHNETVNSHTTTNSNVDKTITENFNTQKNINENTNKEITDLKNKVDNLQNNVAAKAVACQEAENFKKEFVTTKTEIINKVNETLKENNQKVSNYEESMKKLENYQTIVDKMTDLERELKTKNELVETKQENYTQKINDLNEKINVYQSAIDKDKVSALQLELLRKDIAEYEAEICEIKKEAKENYANVLNEFGETVGDVTEAKGVANKLKALKAEFQDFAKGVNLDKVKEKRELERLKKLVENLDFGEEVEANTKDIAEMKLDIETIKDEIEDIKERLCKLEKCCEQSHQMKKDYDPVIKLLKDAGLLSISPDKLSAHFTGIKA